MYKRYGIRINSRYVLRACLVPAAIFVPFILLIKGIYGSFLFCFSVPILWQIGYLNKSFSSLGFRIKSLGVSIVSGAVSGVVLGLFGGKILQLLDLTNYSLTNAQDIHFGIGVFAVKLSLARELGYQLLVMSNTFRGLLFYLSFSVLVIGLGEEMFWRGFIQQKIAKRVQSSAAIGITAGLFALTHLYVLIFLPVAKSIILISLIGVAGVIWGYLYEKTRNIWGVAISHGIAAFILWKYFFFT